MITPIHTALNTGTHGTVIEAECHIANGLPAIIIVGLGNKTIDEARERIRSAFASSNIRLPAKRITINLAPADVPKESTSLDLPIAAAILQFNKQIARPFTNHEMVIGELGLDGSVRPVRGIIGKILVGKRAGITTFFIPTANIAQAKLVPSVLLAPVETIQDLYLHKNGQHDIAIINTGTGIAADSVVEPPGQRLSDVVGQMQAKRALTIAAAGGHNILLSGPPGTGKSMLAKAMSTILPPPSQEEMLEITHLHSLATTNYEQVMRHRPFRAPHHSASHVAMVGGGAAIKPGEISLSHQGILFMDELPEFSRSTIEALRQPLEDQTIAISRAKETVVFPANFILVATANPCPCGYYDTKKTCLCTAQAVMRYKQKISGPILDRIDIVVSVEEVDHERLLAENTTATSEDISAKNAVVKARALQQERFKNSKDLNATMTNADIRSKSRLKPEARQLLTEAAKKLDFSARTYMRVIKVGRTIADLAQSTHILPEHIAEALQYRGKV